MITKFKYNDIVTILPLDIDGECVDIVPRAVVNGQPVYDYKVYTIQKGFIICPEHILRLKE
jgi:hypothetical protein